MDYLPRIIDTELDLRLRAVGATVIILRGTDPLTLVEKIKNV